MEQSPSWEANRFSANQKISRNLWNPKVHYSIHKCPAPVPILSYSLTVSQHDTFLRRGVVSNPQAGGSPLVGSPRLLIQYIRSYPPYWRPFLHPQPYDVPCCGDRDPLNTDPLLIHWNIITPLSPDLSCPQVYSSSFISFLKNNINNSVSLSYRFNFISFPFLLLGYTA
jgi:hypothetical protein